MNIFTMYIPLDGHLLSQNELVNHIRNELKLLQYFLCSCFLAMLVISKNFQPVLFCQQLIFHTLNVLSDNCTYCF